MRQWYAARAADVALFNGAWLRYITEDDVIVLDLQVVAQTYLTGWFVPDLLSSLPLEALMKVAQSSSTANQDSAGSADVAKTTKVKWKRQRHDLRRIGGWLSGVNIGYGGRSSRSSGW